MVSYDKKDVCLPILFDSIRIENYIFSLPHAKISISSCYDWITKYVESLSNEEVEKSNMLID